MKILIIISYILIALNAALLLAAWNANAKPEDQGGAEAGTMAEISPSESTRGDQALPVFPIRGEYWKTSSFGVRKSPFTGRAAIHYGTDYGAPEGAEIQAVKSGVVVTHWPAPDGYYKGHPVMGGFIEILHDDGLSGYAHLSRTFIHEGDRVEAGQLIGIIGNTGMTVGKTGRHLHFSYQKDPGVLWD